MCQHYVTQLRQRLVPKSISNEVNQALNEWAFTSVVHDNLTSCEVCGLCGKERIRYQFQIENELTKNKMWVGSSCILKFGVPVVVDGRKLPTDEAKQRLSRLTDEMRLQSCISALEVLDRTENNPALSNALKRYKSKSKLTPKQIALIIWRLDHHKIDYKASFFSIDLTRKSYQDDIKQFPEWKIHKMWPALSSSQRKRVMSFGFKAPNAI